MANNPLKKYFRQPKVFINLPSKGIYSAPGTISGETEGIPVFGMTGMDELIMKTPDALLSGESTVRVIESCCPSIKDAWGVSIIDLDLILTGIRIATYGNNMSVTHTCPSCSAVNDYEVDLGNIIQHFSRVEYDNTIPLKDVTIRTRPLDYRTWTEFQKRNFTLQRQVFQVSSLEDEDERQKQIASLYVMLADIQRESLLAQIDEVQIPETTVNQREYIQEWLANSEQAVYDGLKAQIEKNRKAGEVPDLKVECPECHANHEVVVNMDQSSFFANA